MDIKNKIEFQSKVYENIQNMINFADSKASISLSIQSLVISITIGSSLLTNIFEKVRNLANNPVTNIFYILMIIVCISSFIGILSCILVYKARQPKNKDEKCREGIIYFGHISKYRECEDYSAKLDKINEKIVFNEYSSQIYELSKIASDKMRYVNYSIFFLIFNLFLGIIIFLLNGYLNSI